MPVLIHPYTTNVLCVTVVGMSYNSPINQIKKELLLAVDYYACKQEVKRQMLYLQKGDQSQFGSPNERRNTIKWNKSGDGGALSGLG